MGNTLPRELVSNVLSRLPARDLLNCKFVCKFWFDIITDPHFITNYYVDHNNLMHSEEHLLVIRRPFVSNLKTYISLLSWNDNDPSKKASSTLLNLVDEYNYDWTEIMGPCNGIYFLEGKPNVIINPSLGQFIVLPQSNCTAPCGTYYLTDYAGFGFDPKTNDYKVVVIKDLGLMEIDERQIGNWTAELYSLNSNSWRKLDAASALPLPIEILGSSRVYTYVNNCYHWFGIIDESGRTGDAAVLAFDMVEESFRKIKVPKIGYSLGEDFATLAPFNENATIGVIVYPIRGTEKQFDVWVMKDYWDEGSWFKQYTLKPVDIIYKILGFYGSNRFVWKDNNERLVLYDFDSEVQTRGLQVYGKDDSIRGARYMESLVSLQRGKEISGQCFSCSLIPDHLISQCVSENEG